MRILIHFGYETSRRPRRRALAASAIAATLAVLGCNAQRTTLWPYSVDRELDGLVSARAAATCRCLRGGADLPMRAFTTDGCSASPDGDWVGCCVAHDIEYWCGGSAEDRRHADDRFALCVERLGHAPALARTMKAAVRAGGAPRTGLPWRWAYGWSGVRGYDASDLPGDPGACFGR